jgi:hypothetical protein
MTKSRNWRVNTRGKANLEAPENEENMEAIVVEVQGLRKTYKRRSIAPQ